MFERTTERAAHEFLPLELFRSSAAHVHLENDANEIKRSATSFWSHSETKESNWGTA
jgi:hypothetical protein